jgi:hypothetical protein
LNNTKRNAIQNSNSKRTLACDAESHVAPGPIYASFVGQAGQDGSEADKSASISLDSTDAGARETNHDPKIKFSEGTKERDQCLTKLQWRKLNKETTEEERDTWWSELDPNAPNHPETEELEMDCWDECKDEEEEAKIKQRAKEKRAMLDAPGGRESSRGSEKLSESDGMQSGRLSQRPNGSGAARRTGASSIELVLEQREKPVEPSPGHSSVGSETSEHVGTVLPSESGEEEIGRSTLYPDNAKQKLRRGRRFS